MNLLSRKEGFTLIEIMIVVALLGILAAIAIPTYLGIQKRAARSEAKANLQAISVALEGYMAENNSFGDKGVYPYSPLAKSFVGHPGNIAAVANLGAETNYDYSLRITTAVGPYYIITAVPLRGRVAGDIRFSIDSNGVKIPSEW